VLSLGLLWMGQGGSLAATQEALSSYSAAASGRWTCTPRLPSGQEGRFTDFQYEWGRSQCEAPSVWPLPISPGVDHPSLVPVTSPTIWDCTIQGPADSPYKGGTFELEFEFFREHNYRIPPPRIQFMTTCFCRAVDPYGNVDRTLTVQNLDPEGDDAVAPAQQIAAVANRLLQIMSGEVKSDSHANTSAAELLDAGNTEEFNRIAREWSITYAGAHTTHQMKVEKLSDARHAVNEMHIPSGKGRLERPPEWLDASQKNKWILATKEGQTAIEAAAKQKCSMQPKAMAVLNPNEDEPTEEVKENGL